MAKAHDLKLSVCTLNVRGLRENQKRQTVFHWLKQQNTDLICLQETYCTSNNVTKFEKEWNGKSCHCLSTSSHKCGVSILTSKRLDIEVKDVHFDKCGRKILINCNIQNENFTLVGIYAPNKTSHRREFINNLSSWVTQHATFESNLILLGDLNTISILLPKIC